MPGNSCKAATPGKQGKPDFQELRGIGINQTIQRKTPKTMKRKEYTKEMQAFDIARLLLYGFTLKEAKELIKARFK
jgi:hypothetical protein